MKSSRIGLLGDVHAEDNRLEAALNFFQAQQVDTILCTGDVVDGYGDNARCCRLLKEAGVITVRGNHDRWLMEDTMRDLPGAITRAALDAESLSFIGSLPVTREIETVAGSLLLCHGVGPNDMRRLTADDCGYALDCMDELQQLLKGRRYRFAVGGHTHRRMVRHFGFLTFINAGTLFQNHSPCLALADLVQNEVTFYDFQETKIAAEAMGLEPTGFKLIA